MPAERAICLCSRSIVPAGCVRRPRNVLQYLPGHAWQLGDVHRDKERLVAREQLCARSTAGLILIIDIRKRLLVVVAHDEARCAFLDRPGRRERVEGMADCCGIPKFYMISAGCEGMPGHSIWR